MSEATINIDEFEFYYLVELTLNKTKPLSRWEKPLHSKAKRWLKRKGFYVETVPRLLLNGKRIYETVFSTSSHFTDNYYKKFCNTQLGKKVSDQKIEGFLFGYPSCCVRQFIEHPYCPNHLKKDDQEKLFHWACPDCRITPELIPYYLKTYIQTKDWYEQFAQLHEPYMHHKFIQQRHKIAAAIASFLLSTGFLSAQSFVDSTHFIPLADDSNQNNLSYAEEIWLGHFDMSNLSESQATAKNMATLIDSLPSEPTEEHPVYRIDYLMRGVFQCAMCDSMINMGYVTIINSQRHLQIDLPYMALHFMKHGSFSWANIQDSYYQRLDIDTLKRIIDPYDAVHMLPVNGDHDGDGLTDAEEDSLWMLSTYPDMNGDGVPDGAEVAEELIRIFPKLKDHSDGIHSSITYNLVWGLENCKICGTMHNMGTVTITNPENSRSCEIPIIALHTMAHGSFAYNGTVHQDARTNVINLIRTIKTHMVFINDDDDNDGLKNSEEEKFGFDPTKADTNNDGVCDGKELGLKYTDIIKSLPTEPRLDGPYVQYLGMDGVHLCSVCGKEIVMGVWEIYNPLINTTEPLRIKEYALHFMEHGSFEYQGTLAGRIDPQTLANYLGVVTHINQEIIPESFILKQNYPNPFNSTTMISYQLPVTSRVDLSIYNILGKKITTLVSQKQSHGSYKVVLDAGGLSSGVYLYKLEIDKDYVQTRKLILLK